MQSSADKIDLIIQQNPEIWKSKAMFFSFIKGILRKGWVRHPVKLKLINKRRKQIPNPNPKGKKLTVWGGTCEICGKDFPIGDIEVDHRRDEYAHLTKLEDIQSCVELLLCVTESDLRLVCKEDHAVESYRQRMNISFEEAILAKKAIAFGKLSAQEQIKELTNLIDSETIIPKTKAGLVELFKQTLVKG